jgi:hypothetical protein
MKLPQKSGFYGFSYAKKQALFTGRYLRVFSGSKKRGPLKPKKWLNLQV